MLTLVPGPRGRRRRRAPMRRATRVAVAAIMWRSLDAGNDPVVPFGRLADGRFAGATARVGKHRRFYRDRLVKSVFERGNTT